MFQSTDQNIKELEKLAAVGSDAIAYMRQIKAEEVINAFPDTQELEDGQTYWALFAADGTPLVLAQNQEDVFSSAFYNDLKAILPN